MHVKRLLFIEAVPGLTLSESHVPHNCYQYVPVHAMNDGLEPSLSVHKQRWNHGLATPSPPFREYTSSVSRCISVHMQIAPDGPS